MKTGGGLGATRITESVPISGRLDAGYVDILVTEQAIGVFPNPKLRTMKVTIGVRKATNAWYSHFYVITLYCRVIL